MVVRFAYVCWQLSYSSSQQHLSPAASQSSESAGLRLLLPSALLGSLSGPFYMQTVPWPHVTSACVGPVSVTRLSCFVDSLGPFVLLTCYHGGRFCRTDIVKDHKRLITINNYFSQDWNDFNLAVRISSLRFSFGRDWNDKFQLRCSNDKFQLRCSNSTESDQSHARRPEDRNCHPVDRGRLRIPKHITNEMHEWVKTLGWGRIGSR